MLPLKPQRFDDQRDEQGRPLSLREAMHRLFDESIWDPFEDRRLIMKEEFPKIDVSENDKEVKVVANIPGVETKDLSLEVDEDSLTLSGSTSREDEQNDERYYRYEREFGEFSRDILLPARVDPEQVSAVSKNGVVTITLPKVEETSGKKKVNVSEE